MSNSCKIINIESDELGVRIDFKYINCHAYGGWVRIAPETFIRPSGSNIVLTMTNAEEIPITPNRLQFKDSGDVLYYTLYFPPLPQGTEVIDVIEDETDLNSFNFFEVTINQKIKIMNNNSKDLLKKIENIALELKGNHKNIKFFSDEIIRLEVSLKELSDLFKISKEETAILCLGIYHSVSNETFCLSDLKKHTAFSPFDFYQIKGLIRNLLRIGWLKKTGNVGIHRSMRRTEEKEYALNNLVMEKLFKGEVPQITPAEPNVYVLTEMLYSSLKEFVHNESDENDLNNSLKEYEEEYASFNPFKMALDMELNPHDRIIYYYMVTKTLIGEGQVEIESIMYNLFKNYTDRILAKKSLTECKSQLFTEKIIEYVNEEFKTDKTLKLTEDAVKRIFGEDAFFKSKNESYSSGLCKTILYEKISEKELFYNERERRNLIPIYDCLKEDKLTEVIKRLEDEKMQPGITALLYGSPGTGKTETIYQIARQTKRNILLVNISEIRDKFVGESEKRLKSVFETYRNSLTHYDRWPILLFNESDALIGKRINVSSSVDQMNNSMQNILLQELEDFKGILMATTNLTINLDEAFNRRFFFKINFSKPSIEAKAFIWKNKLNLLSDGEARLLAEEFDFSGGQIANVARKIFLDSLLYNKNHSMSEIAECCKQEILAENNSKKIGF